MKLGRELTDKERSDVVRWVEKYGSGETTVKLSYALEANPKNLFGYINQSLKNSEGTK